MIVHLDKEQARSERRALLADYVYILFHGVLKELQGEGKTDLLPVELFLSAREFVKTLLALPDVMEGLDDEIDDLEDETEGEHDAMLILMLSTGILQALSMRRVGVDMRAIIIHIYSRLDEHPLFDRLLYAASKKEETRRLEGKKAELLSYELELIADEGGGTDEITKMFAEIIEYSEQMGDKEYIKEQLLFLGKYNIEHNHAYDASLLLLYNKLGIKSKTIINAKEYIAVKHVENQVDNVESGGTGVLKTIQE